MFLASSSALSSLVGSFAGRRCEARALPFGGEAGGRAQRVNPLDRTAGA